ncbi:unnamed protein product [Arabidopsis arenosa]|uniref:RNase H type-1 domain-containing protein n=1 Tax=Arabidopsis arenosa TaxID=38785 RepID=A0A8S1ZEW5_ARAAE|nr:unnamed protein product [Arabidopsis arenosa]
MYISEGPTTFCLTYVYGNPKRKLRQQQWLKMETLVKAGLYQSKPRLVLGDFNEIQCNSEKLGGPAKPEWQFSNFRRMLRVSGLHEVKTYGGLYTWIGNRSTGTVKSKLDRIVATADWKNQFPKALVQLLDWIGSDHRPLLLQTENNKWKGTKQFRYDNRWRFKQDLHMALQKSWDQDCSHLPPQRFCEALKRCRNSLSRWKSAQNLNSHKLIQQLHLAIQKAYDSPSPDYNYIMDLKRKLQHEYQLEEEFWRTKSRIQWMQAGDKNTKYFHAKTQQRRSHNRITSIQDTHGTIQKSEKEIQKVVHSYFTDVYSSSGSNNLEPVLQHIQSKVTVEMNQQLTKPVSEGEIYQALSHMNVDKAPGPDGLNAGFYKYHWPTIKSANKAECQQVLQLLQLYANASGQHVNFQKSAILFGKSVPTDTQQYIKGLMGISRTGFGRYLGLPEAVGRNKYDAFAYISQRVQHKLDNCKCCSSKHQDLTRMYLLWGGQGDYFAFAVHCRLAREIWELSPIGMRPDGSWIDSNSKAGIGWALYTSQGRCVLYGSSSTDPTSSALEAEAVALREAILQLKKLNYQQVTFCGDSLTLYRYLEHAVFQHHPEPGNHEIQNYIEDILALAKGRYCFKFVGREENVMADNLAKQARQKLSPYTISWVY